MRSSCPRLRINKLCFVTVLPTFLRHHQAIFSHPSLLLLWSTVILVIKNVNIAAWNELPLKGKMKAQFSHRFKDKLKHWISSRKVFHISWNNSEEPETERPVSDGMWKMADKGSWDCGFYLLHQKHSPIWGKTIIYTKAWQEINYIHCRHH